VREWFRPWAVRSTAVLALSTASDRVVLSSSRCVDIGESRSCTRELRGLRVATAAGMQPVTLVREVPTRFEAPAWFWKVVAGAALSSLMSVVLLAWHTSHVRTRHVHVVTHAMCGAPR
jgi:hypothetical protein